MQLDTAVIIMGIIFVIAFYAWAFRPDLSYADKLGTAFVLAFVFLLLGAAVSFSYGNMNLANQLSEYAYFAILIGVILSKPYRSGERKSPSF